jgi:thiosulfate dehydrogenase (quinone) large subunit
MKDFTWKSDYIKAHPIQTAGISLFLVCRFLYALLFLYGFYHKITKGWVTTDIMTTHFEKMYLSLPAGSFQSLYMQYFAIPLITPIAWIVTVGELIIGVALMLGVTTRINAACGLFMLLNFAAGGFYNWTIPPLVVMSVLLILLPSGHWLGLDRSLNEKYPDSPWFR